MSAATFAMRALVAGMLFGAIAGGARETIDALFVERWLASGLRWLTLSSIRAAAFEGALLGLGVGVATALPLALGQGASERAARLARILALVATGAALAFAIGREVLWARYLAQTPAWRVGLELFGIVLASGAVALGLVALARRTMPRSGWLVGLAAGVAVLMLAVEPLRPHPTGPNLLLVSIDTLRADRLGAYGHRAARTPSIDGLALTGTLFETVVASAPVTLTATATLLTGLDPQEHGAHYNGFFRLRRDAVTLAELLADRGYATAAVIGNFALDRHFGVAQGFGAYDDRMQETMVAGGGGHAPGGTWWTDFVNTQPFQRFAGEVTDSASAWLDANGDRPFFLWVHYMDPHKPYEPPPAFQGGDPYDGEVAYVDAELGRLLADYRLRFPEAKTLIAVVADHGESLGEHGATGHVRVLYEQTLRVPFILNLPGVVPRRTRVRSPLRGRDVPFEILRALGVEPGPFGLIEGAPSGPRGRAPEDTRWWAYAETYHPLIDRGAPPLRAIHTGRWKLIHQQDGKTELYDLGVDPGELRDRSQADPERVAELKQLLELELRGGDAAPGNVDPDTLERLRALGYVR